ncbi:MAG: hypothetical protein JNK90_16495 [Planctomycetaceae bacterium]|nr:hypothetical protein [Planctomycetaceae bacterium]
MTGQPPMDFDRNRYFTIGVIVFLLGIQFRMVDSFVLNEPSTRALAKFGQQTQMASNDPATEFIINNHPSPKKTVRPPRWLGWIMLTSGAVMCLHAFALPKPNK